MLKWATKRNGRFYATAFSLLLFNLLMVKINPEGPATTLIEYILFTGTILLVLHALLTFIIDIVKRYL